MISLWNSVRTARLGVVASMCIALLVATTAGADEPDPRIAKMEKGDTVVSVGKTKKGHQKFKMMAILNAKPEKVWDIIKDCSKYTKTMTRLKSAKLIRSQGNTFVCETVVDVPFPLKPLRAVTEAKHTVVKGKKYKRAWKMLEGDYKVNQGSWTLKAYEGDRTLVIYKNVAEPNVEIPKTIRDMARKKALPDLMAHIRKQVEK